VNENGNIMETWPGAGYTMVIETPGHGKKFLVYEYNYSVIPYRTYTHVYSLPESGINTLQGLVRTHTPLPPYPNPADRLIHIPVMLPRGESEGTLRLFDLKGNLLMTYPVTSIDTEVVLPAQKLAAGTYLYHIQTSGSRSDPGKIIVP
jgi:hypothetical protein